MEDFVIKRFIKGVIILVLSGLLIGVGRGISDTIQFLNQPRNIYNSDSIYVPIGIDDLYNASYQSTSSHSNFFYYELSNGEIGGASNFFLEEEDKQIAEEISGAVGHTLKRVEIGVDRLAISRISFVLNAESTANVKVYLVNKLSYLYGIPKEGEAVVHEFERTNASYELEIPRLYADATTNQWTYALFYIVVIALADGTPFTLSDTKLTIPLQRK